MIEIDSDKKLEMVKMILDDVYEIMIHFKPLVEEMLKLDGAQKYREDGTFLKIATLFGDIAKRCKEIELYPFSEEFLSNIKN